MLKIWFSNVKDNMIKNHERIEFNEAVKLTHELEKKCRKEEDQFSSDFTVINEETNEALYSGTFHFGSYDYPNVYQQIKDKSERIKVSKQKQIEKNFLLEKIEELTDPVFKEKEKIDKTIINLDRKRISKLKSWQRRTLYTIGTVSFFLLVLTATTFLLQKIQYEQALKDGKGIVEEKEELIKFYEKGLLGNKNEMVEHLLEGDTLTENQEVLLANHYIEQDEFDKAVDILESPSKVETLILTKKGYNNETKAKKIKAFDEVYSTNEARFDLAYFNNEFELMLKIPEVDMILDRSIMKTRAHLKLDQLDEAKAELKNNNDENMKEKISKYEILVSEIDTLEEKKKKAKKKKEKNKINKELKKKKEEKSKL